MSNNGIRNQVFSIGTWLCDGLVWLCDGYLWLYDMLMCGYVTWFVFDLCFKERFPFFTDWLTVNLMSRVLFLIKAIFSWTYKVCVTNDSYMVHLWHCLFFHFLGKYRRACHWTTNSKFAGSWLVVGWLFVGGAAIALYHLDLCRKHKDSG